MHLEQDCYWVGAALAYLSWAELLMVFQARQLDLLTLLSNTLTLRQGMDTIETLWTQQPCNLHRKMKVLDTILDACEPQPCVHRPTRQAHESIGPKAQPPQDDATIQDLHKEVQREGPSQALHGYEHESPMVGLWPCDGSGLGQFDSCYPMLIFFKKTVLDEKIFIFSTLF